MADQSKHPSPLAVAELRYEVVKKPLSLTLTLPAPAQSAMKKALETRPKKQTSPAVLLSVEGIQFEMKASGTVEVYLNLREDVPRKDIGKPHAVGTFTSFTGHAHPPAGGGLRPPAYPKERGEHADAPRFSRVFDVTDVLRRLREAGPWKESELQITLIRRPLDRKERPLAGKVTFSRIVLHLATGP